MPSASVVQTAALDRRNRLHGVARLLFDAHSPVSIRHRQTLDHSTHPTPTRSATAFACCNSIAVVSGDQQVLTNSLSLDCSSFEWSIERYVISTDALFFCCEKRKGCEEDQVEPLR